MLAKTFFQLYSILYLAWLQSSTRELATVASIFKIGISQNTKCDNLVSFPKSGHKYTIAILKIGVNNNYILAMEFIVNQQNQSIK